MESITEEDRRKYLESITEEERRRYYAFCFFNILFSVGISGILVHAVYQKINFSRNGNFTKARIERTYQVNSSKDYLFTFNSESDSLILDALNSVDDLGQVGDSIEIYYFKNNSSTGLASDIRGNKSIFIPFCIDVFLITLVIVALKRPRFILRFKGSLDQY